MKELEGLNKNSSAAATSSASPTRFNACIPSDAFRAAGLPVIRAAKGVFVRPGATQFTRMFLGAYVEAALRARPVTPALAAAMASWLGMPCLATADEQNTMEPPPLPIMRFTEERSTLKQDVRFSLMTWSNSASEVVCADLSTMLPTQFATPLMWPWVSTALAMASSTCLESVTSAVSVEAEAPSSACRVLSFPASRPTSTTLEPWCWARRLHNAEPMPPVAPNTT
mmetsp:Transcript_16535/g.35769  ORF Transcript_16535/g.35769 Transcript_16535/m.35769 type:complete len:226 (-) Transcript_16535:174-851(-)